MTFVPEAALIALREGLEALLIVGLMLALVTRTDHAEARKHVWGGFLGGVAASLALGFVVQRYLLTAFEEAGYGAVFELAAALLAVLMLTYMAFWMWSHTRTLMRGAHERVTEALTAGNLAVIAGLVFASVLREGIEVVLFYAALASQVTAVDLAVSGIVGFAASAGLVLVVFRSSRSVDLERFFAWTGAFLLVIAAMLLTHVTSALVDLGLLPAQPALWDTSAWIAGGSALGRVLHAVVGYTPTPTLYQAGAYVGFLAVAGSAYLWKVGAFHAGAGRRGDVAPRRLAAAVLVLVLAVAAVSAGAADPVGFREGGHHHGLASADHDRDEGAAAELPTEPVDVPPNATVGVLLRAHGEPVHYNESTYWQFRNFTKHLLEMLGYGALLHEDEGTVLLDRSRPFQKGPHADPDLVDAWLRPHDGPAAYAGSPAPQVQEVPFYDGYYKAPGGPGLGEPDILEMAGLSIHKAWIQMEGESPMHGTKTLHLDVVEELLTERYGDRVVVARAHHIEPEVEPRDGLPSAARELADADVDVVVDAYTSALHSDVMNTCMKEPAAHQALQDAGVTAPIVAAGPMGPTPAYGEAVADEVVRQLDRFPDGERVAVFLTHHGLDPDYPSPCRDREDPYNAQAQAMYGAARAALANRSLDRPVEVMQVYGQGAGAPDDGVLSPEEALDEAAAWNATHVLDLPYELPGDGYDNLVVHRGNYGLAPEDAPHHDANRETHLTRQGMQVVIASSAFGVEDRGGALFLVVEEAVRTAVDEVLRT